jgi:hypothetical protein
MAFVWLKAVPWSTIIANAPLIVDGARKLVSLVRNTSAPERRDAQVAGVSGGPDAQLAALHARIAQLESEQRQSAELLSALADSNEQMAQAVEYLRKRATFNGRIAGVALLGLVLLGAWVLLR